MIKSHYPEWAGTEKFEAEKCICVIWNPLDCLVSLFHMIGTGSHNNSITEEDFTKYYDLFDQFVRQDI